MRKLFGGFLKVFFYICYCRKIRRIELATNNLFAEYNQHDATFHNLFISVRRFTCFRRFFRPSLGAQNCTYRVRYWSDKYLTLYVQFWAPDDGWKNRLKHVERLTEINKLWSGASCWLYSANIFAMHGPMNVKQSIAAHCSVLSVLIYSFLLCFTVI